MTGDDCLALGRVVGRNVCPHGRWSEDVQAAAALGAWRARPGREAVGARMAAIDELRRLTGYGRRGRKVETWWLDKPIASERRTHGNEVTLRLIDVLDECMVEDDYLLDDPLAGCTTVQRLVVEMVADGWPKTTVAAALGVAPCTVSYHLRQVRRRLQV